MLTPRQARKKAYTDILHQCQVLKKDPKLAVQELCRVDLFFLLLFVLGREDVDRDWIFDRCMDVQANPDGYLDIWARGHYKSTIITYAKTIQDIINNPSITICILSHNRTIAKGFLRQIKYELETNLKLKALFPDIFYTDPAKESPKWSEDDGLVVKRPNPAPKESTVEAWGLVDGQPTSKHFKILMYNDVVVDKSVTTPEMIRKTTQAWELSLNLKTEDGIERYEGTYYHFADTYHEIDKRKAAKLRLHPATKNGKLEGEPVLLTREELMEKRGQQGSYVFNCQLLLDPAAEGSRDFSESNIKYWPATHYQGMNIYIICDPANEKKKKSDYTCFMVIGIGADNNYYVIEMVRDKLNLKERENILFRLHKEYNPRGVGYEKYGKDTDIESYKARMERDNYRFDITALGGTMSKGDRIRRLQSLFEEKRIYLPERCIKTNWEGKIENLTEVFINDEYKTHPVCSHDDMLDCLSRICDAELSITLPKMPKPQENMAWITAQQQPNYNPLESMA